jgi:hypothetical protein
MLCILQQLCDPDPDQPGSVSFGLPRSGSFLLSALLQYHIYITKNYRMCTYFPPLGSPGDLTGLVENFHKYHYVLTKCFCRQPVKDKVESGPDT